jgi:hypothetical protein
MPLARLIERLLGFCDAAAPINGFSPGIGLALVDGLASFGAVSSSTAAPGPKSTSWPRSAMSAGTADQLRHAEGDRELRGRFTRSRNIWNRGT